MFKLKPVCKCLQLYSQSPKTGKNPDVLQPVNGEKAEVHPYSGLQLSNREEPSMDTRGNMDESQIFVWHSGKDMDIGTEQTSSCQGMSLTAKGHQDSFGANGTITY